MKRQIKFRAWNELPDGTCEMVTEENSGLLSYKILERFSNVMQYTGVDDVNGVEIYDGDVLRDEDDYIDVIDVVFWDEEYLQWNTKPNYIERGNMESMMVIGNIYENPELIR